MRRISSLIYVALAAILLGMSAGLARAQGTFEHVTGKTFDSAFPKDFYLEGNAIPTEKRNAAMLKTPGGARVLLALIDTAGYSSQIKQKYTGMLINEGKLAVCGHALGVGSYGFGMDKPPATSNEDAKFFVYDQAGSKVAECAAKKDAKIAQPKPLQVVLGKEEPAKLYLGRYVVDLQ